MIPRRCVLTADSLEEIGKISHSGVSGGAGKANSRSSWPAYLTASALRALHSSPSSAANEVDWPTWIHSWTGGGDSPSRRPESYSQDELSRLAQLAGSSQAVVLEAINARFASYVRHLDQISAIVASPLDITGAPRKIEEDAAALYGVVLSRSANLGPTWDYTRGVIPLHDMLNHPPPGTGANVELFSYGDIKSFAPPDAVAGIGGKESEDRNRGGTMPNERSTLDDQDIVLVARKTIHLGDELFLSYKGKGEGDNTEEKQRAWLLLQYGFPLGRQ